MLKTGTRNRGNYNVLKDILFEEQPRTGRAASSDRAAVDRALGLPLDSDDEWPVSPPFCEIPFGVIDSDDAWSASSPLIPVDDEKRLVLEAVARKGSLLYFASDVMKADRMIVLQAVAGDGLALQYACDALKADREVVLGAVSQAGSALRFASEELRAAWEVVVRAVSQDGCALQFASEELRANCALVHRAVSQHGRALQFASDGLRADSELALRAVALSGSALEFAPKKLTADRKFMLQAVALDGSALQFASEELRAEREVVLRAVALSGSALQCASKELRSDKDVVLQAVAEDGLAFHYAADELRADRELVLQAVARSGLALQDACHELKADREVVMQAVANNGLALNFASEELRADREVALQAVKQDAKAFQFVAPELRAQGDLILQVGIAHGSFQKVFEAKWEEWHQASQHKWRRELCEDHSFIKDAIHACPEDAAFLLRRAGFEDIGQCFIFDVAFTLSGSTCCIVIVQGRTRIRSVLEEVLRKLQVQESMPEEFELVLSDLAKVLRQDAQVDRCHQTVAANGKINAVTMVRVQKLRNSTEEERRDRELVLQFVNADGLDLQWADATLQDSEDVVLAAVQQDFNAFEYASYRLRHDREFLQRLRELPNVIEDPYARSLMALEIEDPHVDLRAWFLGNA